MALTNLTEIRMGWFGPTNTDDPLTGDMWWAAELAIREANEQRKTPANHSVHAPSSSELANAPESPGPLSASAPKRPEGGAPAPSSDSSSVMRHASCASLPFRLIPRWAVDPWGTGISQLTRMVYDEQPLALLGSVDSATTHLAEQVVAKANLPLVSPIATDKSVTLAGVSWMFSCAPSDDAIARVLVDDILVILEGNLPGSSRRKEALTSPRSDGTGNLSLLTSAATSERAGLALLTCTDHESRMTTREVLKELSRRGRPPSFRFEVPPGGQAFPQQMAALAAASPAAVIIIAGAEDAARLAVAVREHLPQCARYGSHTMGRRSFRELAGSAAEGIRFPLLFAPDPTNPAHAHFIEQFTQQHLYPPDYTAALSYDATLLLLEAIRRAGPDRAGIREALAQLSPWPGIAGPICFDGTGQNTRTNICMAVIRNHAVVSFAPQKLLSPTPQKTASP